ncbi:MAG: HD domain-containing protein [Saprospiraceae bacterium]|nr:HD domain-containing protein [Candidatus Opimibacter skivensis]
MNKMKLINDPVYGLIHIRTPLIFDLIEHPLFQRLRRIKQTGLTHLVYPGSQHTRFHHALGAMHLMGMAIDELRSKQTDISEKEEEAALIAVLLHDIGHSPYSHALERLIIDADHEAIGKMIMLQFAKSLGSQLDLAYDMFTGKYHRPFFHQLISGQLDLDRLDYLSRDSFYTGVAEGVVGHDRILRMLRVVDNKLVVEEKGLYSIEKFLVARRIMYWQVYLHKTALAAELMAKAVIRLLREQDAGERAGYLAPELEFFLSKKVTIQDFRDHPDELLAIFSDLDDISVDYSIKRLQDHFYTPLSFLTTNLFHRKLHKLRWSDEPLEDEMINDIRKKCQEKYDWSPEIADKMIWLGSETKADYNREDDEIQILTKSEEIKPFSSFLETPVRIAFNKKYYICHPLA